MSGFIILFGFFMVLVGVDKYHKPVPLRKWSFSRVYFMFAYCMWGLGFVATGLADFFPSFSKELNIFYGATFILMIFAPCGADIFNKDPLFQSLRSVVFLSLSILITAAA